MCICLSRTAVIVLVAIDSSGTTVLCWGTDGQCVAADGDSEPKEIEQIRIGRLHVRLLAPGAARAREDIDGPGTWASVIGLIAIHAG